jgi:hypothetical protein
VHHAPEVDVDGVAKVGQRHVGERARLHDAGVVDEDVDAPEVLLDLFDEVGHRSGVAHVDRAGDDRAAVPAERRRRLLELLPLARADGERAAGPRQLVGDHAPEPARGARHQRDATAQLLFGQPPRRPPADDRAARDRAPPRSLVHASGTCKRPASRASSVPIKKCARRKLTNLTEALFVLSPMEHFCVGNCTPVRRGSFGQNSQRQRSSQRKRERTGSARA